MLLSALLRVFYSYFLGVSRKDASRDYQSKNVDMRVDMLVDGRGGLDGTDSGFARKEQLVTSTT